MARWFIEKSGTGIEKSGTGIEKSGTGIEKAGTGIEKSGTGIEKSGTGIEKTGTGVFNLFLCAMLVTAAFSTSASTSSLAPEGLLQVVASENSVKVSWILEDSVFSGIAELNGSFANVVLTEVSLIENEETEAKTVGSGTGSKTVGSGTGSKTVGSGTGAKTVGSGTGAETVGSGTGSHTVGSGTGASTVGSGTGSDTVGSGTGLNSNLNGRSLILTVGAGTGSKAVEITLPGGEGMQMEIALGCNSASVSVLDSNFGEVVSFSNVPAYGASAFCSGGAGGLNPFGLVKNPIEFGNNK